MFMNLEICTQSFSKENITLIAEECNYFRNSTLDEIARWKNSMASPQAVLIFIIRWHMINK